MKRYDLIVVGGVSGVAAGMAIVIAKETGANTHTISVSKVQEKLEEHGAAVR